MKRITDNVEWKTDAGRTLLKLDGDSQTLSIPVLVISIDEIPDFIAALTEAQAMMGKEAKNGE
jgi:hypothetical protein